MSALITLTTDFGTRSPYVAAMKGVILRINPDARLVDLSHEIPPFDLRHAALFLRDALSYFPPATLHVVVVDPGVGSEREILYVDAGQRLLVPDNGCWTLAAPCPSSVRQVRERRHWRPTVSATFHGRDIFAPVAAHLSLGVDPADLGPLTTSWHRVELPAPPPGGGEVVCVDNFGNLITNIPPGEKVPASIALEGTAARLVRAYSDAAPGELVALVGSNGMVEIAVVQGSAAARLNAGVGAQVIIEWET